VAELARALVQHGPKELAVEEFPLPQVESGAALVRVEANGLCRSDVDSYLGHDVSLRQAAYPRILGHEIVGVIDRLAPGETSRDGLLVGERVGVNPFIPCWRCLYCRAGDSFMCAGTRARGPSGMTYGKMPTTEGPALWGGYATHVYIPPDAILYPFPHDLSPLTATLWNPLAGGVQWGVFNSGLKLGDSAVVFGTGQRGLACIAALRAAGAGVIVATGLKPDGHKLALARELGADVVVNVDEEDAVHAVLEATGGVGADIAIDTTPHDDAPLRQGITALRRGGTLVGVGLKTRSINGFAVDQLTLKNITFRGSAGQSHQAYAMAARLLGTGAVRLDQMRTHTFPLEEVPRAIEVLVGVPGEKAINVVITPS
jgi:threonine dehydrogenase-like Zn-dependent dehydrogenase